MTFATKVEDCDKIKQMADISRKLLVEKATDQLINNYGVTWPAVLTYNEAKSDIGLNIDPITGHLIFAEDNNSGELEISCVTNKRNGPVIEKFLVTKVTTKLASCEVYFGGSKCVCNYFNWLLLIKREDRGRIYWIRPNVCCLSNDDDDEVGFSDSEVLFAIFSEKLRDMVVANICDELDHLRAIRNMNAAEYATYIRQKRSALWAPKMQPSSPDHGEVVTEEGAESLSQQQESGVGTDPLKWHYPDDNR